jgi:hypothetical protein
MQQRWIEGAVMPAKTAPARGGKSTKQREKRKSSRLTFRQTQRVAPYASGPLPRDDAFYVVPFSDISQGGFSYLADRPPQHRKLVVAMEIHEQVVLMRARVMNHRKKGQQYVIGCRFEGRIEDQPDKSSVDAVASSC